MKHKIITMNTRYTNCDSVPVEQVKGIQFSILSSDEIRKQSVVHVTSTDLYDKNVPKINGLYDLRMGTTDKSMLCQTCNNDLMNCQGHFGHIDMSFPIYNICYIKQVFKILQCVCMRCSNVLLSDDYKHMYTSIKKVRAILRFKRMYDLIKKQSCCTVCKFDQPKWIFDSAKIECIFTDQENTENISAKIALSILRKIADDDCVLLGFHPIYSHPKNMIIEVLPVPPPVVRPSVMMDPTVRTQDDLTHKLVEIIKSNQQVDKIIKSKSQSWTLDEHIKLLQFHVSTYIDNEIPGQPQATQRTGRPIKSISQRIKSKEGRVRGNLMGKRVDFSARTVITAEPNIKLDELGVPESIARNMTFSERVTSFNKNFLQSCVNVGANPKNIQEVGAKYVVSGKSDQRKDLRFVNELEIQEGDIVERHLMDGDYVVFNRQPTLHKMSMMGHLVKVMKGNTFRLNLSATTPYNADFDGDEMNMHVPCSHDARAEVKELMMVSNNIVSPQSNRPVMGIVQDSLLACSKLTRRDVFLTKKDFTNIMFRLDKVDATQIPIPCILKPVPLWSGKQLFSLVMPKKSYMTLNRFAAQYDDADQQEKRGFSFSDSEVIIKNGELLSGILCKKALGTSSGGLIHKTWTEESPNSACNLISNIQFMSNMWLMDNGFSVGIKDCVNIKDVQEKVDGIVTECIKDAHRTIDEALEKKRAPATYERSMNNILNRARDSSGRFVQQQMTASNNLYSMVSGGSKGSVINIAQIMACVGQQNVNGNRIDYGYVNRTLPHFKKYDNTPESRGFVKHSYMQGLTPTEFYFHAMGGREGVIDTAIKSVTGDTPIIIIEDGTSKYVNIGSWIDNHIETCKNRVQYFPEDRNMEYLELDQEVYIPTGDSLGNTAWALMTAVTRHDPGTRVFEFETMSGRNITVADSESLLVWNGTRFQKKHSDAISINEFVPVMSNLPTSPGKIHLDMQKYFPKDTHIYGTEFNKAIKLMREAQGDKIHISNGWWNDNNGNTFTLPYTKKASLTRAISGRSNIENIIDGCVYPFHARRDSCRFPDNFCLDKEFGTFIGLFLADGNIDEHSGTVCITKKNEEIKTFVKTWLKRYNIRYKEREDTNTMGITHSIHAYSTLLQRFLDMFVGRSAHLKHVPDIAFNAPQEFVIGLLTGYFSGDGHVETSGAISAGSASERLMDGISFLLARIGIFGKRNITHVKWNNFGTIDIKPSHTISIRAQWACLFGSKIELLPAYKNERLKKQNTHKHANYKEMNDVVFDKIIRKTVVPVNGQTKMYDVTVPSTLNFTTASLLIVRDTSETGYTQRRLVKAMEDIRVDFDGTVRNSIGDILQFKYGEDNMDGSKLIVQNFEDTKVYLPIHVTDFITNNTDMVLGRFVKPNQDLTPVFNDVLRAHDISSFDPYILHRTQNAKITPGEMVGIIAAQSLGQPITQMTLNSVEYNTKIIVSEDGNLKEYRIGDWIESRIANGDTSTHQYIERGDQIYAPINKDEDVRILTSDENGNVFWDHVDAVTRHLPINEDGSNTLIRITTLSGHECTVTKGESVLTRQNNKLLKSKGSDMKIGDYLPAMRTLPMLEQHHIQELDVSEYVAKSVVIQPCHFPERLVLDELFGFVIGAYLAEGCVTKHHVLISNNDHTFTTKIEQWVEQIGIKYHYDEGTKQKGYSRTIRIHSIVLARLFNEMFTREDETIDDTPLSVNDRDIDACVDDEYAKSKESKQMVKSSSRTKHLPISLLGAPDACIRGIVDGYFSGDGCFATKQKYITADSMSHQLLENMCLVLRKFDVMASVRNNNAAYRNAKKNGYQTTIPYTLSLNKCNSEQFARSFTLTLKHKQNVLDDYLTNSHLDTKDSLCDKVPHVCLSNGTTRDMTLKDLVTKANDDNASEEDRKVCRTILDAGIYYDRVVKIEEVQSNHTHVFDMTTRISRNFTDKRLVFRDTFHSAGISAMNVTLGVPRLKELINVSKNIKSPCMKIKYKDPVLANEICGVFLNQFVQKTEIMHKYPSPEFELEYLELMDIKSLDDSIEDTEWSILYTINVTKLEEYGLDLLYVTLWLNKTFNYIWCSCSATDMILVRLFSSNNGLDTYSKIKQLSNKLLHEVNIKGYKNVTKCMMNGEYIETMGIDFDNVLTNELVDPYSTTCNDVITAYNVLGIEAARTVLLDEITKVIEFDGSYVDYRHISMLIDTMTYKGNLMAITRHGINRTETGVLMRCSFEETVNIITDAATYAEYDAVKGVTEHIVMGKTAKVGTGTIDVMVNMEKMMQMNMELEPESYYDEFIPSTPSRYDDDEDAFFPLKE